MDANEFWCRAFLAAMAGRYEHGEWANHGAPAAYCERAADAALSVAQRRGMVAGDRIANSELKLERVEFSAQADFAKRIWTLHGRGLPEKGIDVVSGESRVVGDTCTLRVIWGETMPPRPIEVWIERSAR